MWIFKFDPDGKGPKWVVGYFTRHAAGHDQFNGSEWFHSRDDAARRVNYLNGGTGSPMPVEL